MKIKEFLYHKIYFRLLEKCIDWFFYLPVKNNKIVFLHDFGTGYGDSPKVLAQEIMRRGLPYDMVWLVNDMKLEFPHPIRKVLMSRIKSVYELATAKVIITTAKSKYYLKKKSTQFFVYIPHGQIGAKYVERQAGDTLSKGYIDGSIWHSKVSNLFISSSKLHTEEELTWYWYDGEVMECGLPRNDIFFHYTPEDVQDIKKKVGIPDGVKIVLYGPTFRNEPSNEPYAIDTERVLHTLEQKTGGKWIFLFRAHPNFVWYGKPAFEYSDKVMDVTNYPDMQDLLLISDVLISDYSSAMFDFNLMHRPVFLFTKDIEAYQKMRGLKDWYFKVPFPFCHNNDELVSAIANYNEQEYRQKCAEFDKFYGNLETGTAAKQIVDCLQKIMA
ncbi:CDP-glycerol glycerophosphotransferase family protein [Segatella hominis]|uniref:CDP-glycerol glycerophosphotransferase family protein n=1 Tax=Segatella hominis TaxID=2518605 RepID=UPI003AB93EEB